MIPAVHEPVARRGLEYAAVCGVIRTLYKIADTKVPVLHYAKVRLFDRDGVIREVYDGGGAAYIVIGQSFACLCFSWMGATISMFP